MKLQDVCPKAQVLLEASLRPSEVLGIADAGFRTSRVARLDVRGRTKHPPGNSSVGKTSQPLGNLEKVCFPLLCP